MLNDFETVTMLGVLEYDGLICIDCGVARTTDRFQASLQASRRAQRARRNLDLRECISHAMHRMYGKYLTEAEMLSLVDAVLPIAAAEPPAAPTRRSPPRHRA